MNDEVSFCRLIGKPVCDSLRLNEIEEDTYSIDIDDEYGYVLFELETPKKIICSGLYFQTHVWGSTTYYLWLLPHGTNICIVLEDSTLEEVDENVYLINNRRVLAMDHSFYLYIECLKHLLNTRPIFLILDRKRTGTKYMNLIIFSGVDELGDHVIKLLTDKVGERELALDILKGIRENHLPLSILSVLDRINVERRGGKLVFELGWEGG